MTLNGNTRINYLDGLRAIAVSAVIVYHNNSAWLPGGFIGVEIFFVISGFIITRLLYFEFLQTGEINVRAFYLRRLKRLMPTIAVVILTAWVYALTMVPDALYKFWVDLPYAFLSILNWHYIFTDQAYFYYIGRPRTLEHLWSLSVEFQFYLLWPFICILLFKINIVPARILIASLALLSSLAMAYQFYFDADTTPVYFSTHTRASAFLLGALVALCLPEKRINATAIELFLIKAITNISFLFIIFLSFNMTSADGITYYGGLLSISALTAFIIVSCHIIIGERKDCISIRILESSPAKNIGARSYAIYMWHWPVICFFQPILDTRYDGIPLFFYHLLITLILAELSYKIIEKRSWTVNSRTSFPEFYDLTGLPSIALVSIILFSCFSLLLVILELKLFTEQRLVEYKPYENSQENTYKRIPEQILAGVTTDPQSMDEEIPAAKTMNKADDSGIRRPADTPSQTSLTTNKNAADNIRPVAPTKQNNINNKTTTKPQLNKNSYKADDRIEPVSNASETGKHSTIKNSIILIGDSVMSALSPGYTNAVQRITDSHYWTLRFQASVCRKLTTPGCLHGKPESALNVIKNNADVYAAVIMIGHNDDRGAGFRKSVSQLIHELSSIPHVFWITMREVNDSYRMANSIIKEELAENKNTRIIDWAQFSKNQDSWVVKDGTHLTATGARNMASLITMELKSVEQ